MREERTRNPKEKERLPRSASKARGYYSHGLERQASGARAKATTGDEERSEDCVPRTPSLQAVGVPHHKSTIKNSQ